MRRVVLLSLLLSVASAGLLGAVQAGQQSGGGEIAVTLDLSNQKSQFAVWLSDTAQTYRGELFVTRKVGSKGLGNRRGNLDDKLGGARLSALPVWAWMRGVLDEHGNPYPSKQHPLPDAVTGATPHGQPFTCRGQVPDELTGTSCIVWVEINASFDKNDAHHYSWYRGQPSLIYRGTLDLARPGGDEVNLELVGHGSVDGHDGAIDPDLATITTARTLARTIRAVYVP